MSTRYTYTVIVPGLHLISSKSDRKISGTHNIYFESRMHLLECLAKRPSHQKSRKYFIAVHEYTDFNKGLAGCGKLLNFATHTAKGGLVMHGLTPARKAQLRRYIPQAA